MYWTMVENIVIRYIVNGSFIHKIDNPKVGKQQIVKIQYNMLKLYCINNLLFKYDTKSPIKQNKNHPLY